MNKNEDVQGRKLSCPVSDGNYTYILCCGDGSLYTGWTVNLARRLKAHNAGKGAKYTRTRRPVRLVWYESCANAHEAMSREWHIKRLSREEKLQLICGAAPAEDAPARTSVQEEIDSNSIAVL